jgi:hypothetical protein
MIIFEFFLDNKNDEGYNKHNADQPGPKAMKPFPEKNEFEIC